MYLKWKNERRYVKYAVMFWHYFVKEEDILIDLKEERIKKREKDCRKGKGEENKTSRKRK